MSVTEESLYRRIIISGSLNYTGPVKDPPYVWSRLLDARQDSVTKGGPVWDWREKIKRGLNATTNLNGQKYSLVWKNGEAYHRQFNPSTNLYLTYARWGPVSVAPWPGYSIPTALKTSADNKAKQSVMRQIKNTQRSFQSLVSIGEARETVRMIKGVAKDVDRRLADYIEGLKRRGPRGWRRIDEQLSWIANQWLQTAYGVRPLLAETDDAMRALATDYSIRKPHQMCVGLGEEEEDKPQSPLLVNVGAGNNVYVGRQYQTRYLVIYRAMVSATNALDRQISYRTLGFNWNDWVPSLYELIPWSFFLDYFTNVNEIVTAFSNGRVGVSWVSRTTVEEWKHSHTAIRFIPSNLSVGYKRDYINFEPWMSTASIRSVNRGTYEGSLVPSLEFEIPTGPSKWANIAALAYRHRLVRGLLFGEKRNNFPPKRNIYWLGQSMPV